MMVHMYILNIYKETGPKVNNNYCGYVLYNWCIFYNIEKFIILLYYDCFDVIYFTSSND